MRWLAYLFIGLLVQSASAAPVTIGCTLMSTTTNGTRFIEVDQFVYDLEAQSVDMRSAKTVGTNDLVNWLYVTRKDSIFDDTFTMRGGDNWFVGGGIYNETPTAFRLTPDGVMTMTYVQTSGSVEVLRWRCAH